MQIELANNPAGPKFFSGGGYGDVFTYMNQGMKVAIKALKVPHDANLRKVSLVSHSQVILSSPHASAFTAAYVEIL